MEHLKSTAGLADKKDMPEHLQERRTEPRLLCADLMEVEWTEADGSSVTACANLEDISPSGACVQVDKPVPAETMVYLTAERARWVACVKYCVFRETGYFLGLQFEPGVQWRKTDFVPKHLLDPQDLVRSLGDSSMARRLP